MAVEDQELAKLYPGIEKQTRFALAQTLTGLAKKGQKASIEAIHERFVTRGNWMQPSLAPGVRIASATKSKLESSVHTAADWLVKHETGEDRKGTVAVPTVAVRPRITDKITRAKRPRNIAGAFKLTTRTGVTSLFKRVRKKLTPLYRLVTGARIEKVSTVIEPTKAVVKAELGNEFRKWFKKAFDSAR